jgi:hypothetical protein
MRRGVLGVALAVLLGACGGPSSRDYREDRIALARVLAADATTAERMDPVVAALGTERGGDALLARLDGEVRAAAVRAGGLARKVKARTPEGSALRDELVEAMEDRRALLQSLAAAARSGEAADALEAIRAARTLEERLVEIDHRVEALAR